MMSELKNKAFEETLAEFRQFLKAEPEKVVGLEAMAYARRRGEVSRPRVSRVWKYQVQYYLYLTNKEKRYSISEA